MEHRVRREATFKEEEVKKGSKTDIDYKMKEKMSRFVFKKAGDMDKNHKEQVKNTAFLKEHWEALKF